MEDVELVIKIPKEYYNEILAQGMYGSHLMPLYKALVNSTRLPKNHGRLKDVDWIDNNCEEHYPADDEKYGCWCYSWKDIDSAPTIIKATEKKGV